MCYTLDMESTLRTGYYSAATGRYTFASPQRQPMAAPVKVRLSPAPSSERRERPEVNHLPDTFVSHEAVCWACLQRGVNCDCEVTLTPEILDKREGL
jgi:hypothetical protein